MTQKQEQEKFEELSANLYTTFKDSQYEYGGSFEGYLAYVQCVQMFKNEDLLTELLKEIKVLNANLKK